MKKCFLIAFIALSMNNLHAQYDGAFSLLYFSRQSSAKSEAMGRTGVASADGYQFAFHNPALLSLTDKITANFSYISKPDVLSSQPFYYQMSVSHKFDRFGIGLSRFSYNHGRDEVQTDMNGNIVSRFRPTLSMNTLSLSIAALPTLFVGINFSLLNERYLVKNGKNVFPIDLGVLKVFAFRRNETISSKFITGGSFYNLNRSDFRYHSGGQKNELPQLLRLGGTYQLNAKFGSLLDKLTTLSVEFSSEFQDVLNSKRHDGFGFGGQLSLYEVIHLRSGYYQTELPETSYHSGVNRSKVTYGIGCTIPIHKLSHIPVNVAVDYVKMSQGLGVSTHIPDYYSWGIKIDWDIH